MWSFFGGWPLIFLFSHLLSYLFIYLFTMSIISVVYLFLVFISFCSLFFILSVVSRPFSHTIIGLCDDEYFFLIPKKNYMEQFSETSVRLSTKNNIAKENT